MSTQRRSKPLRPDIRPLTPAIPATRAPYADRSHDELVGLVHHLGSQLKAERLRNAKIQRLLVHHLDLLEERAENLRAAFFAQVSTGLIPSPKAGRS